MLVLFFPFILCSFHGFSFFLRFHSISLVFSPDSFPFRGLRLCSLPPSLSLGPFLSLLVCFPARSSFSLSLRVFVSLLLPAGAPCISVSRLCVSWCLCFPFSLPLPQFHSQVPGPRAPRLSGAPCWSHFWTFRGSQLLSVPLNSSPAPLVFRSGRNRRKHLWGSRLPSPRAPPISGRQDRPLHFPRTHPD